MGGDRRRQPLGRPTNPFPLPSLTPLSPRHPQKQLQPSSRESLVPGQWSLSPEGRDSWAESGRIFFFYHIKGSMIEYILVSFP